MATKEDLESLDLIRLALLCQSVADSESIDSSTAREALALRQEWALLVASETLPLSSFARHEEIQNEKSVLKGRIIDFPARLSSAWRTEAAGGPPRLPAALKTLGVRTQTIANQTAGVHRSEVAR